MTTKTKTETKVERNDRWRRERDERIAGMSPVDRVYRGHMMVHPEHIMEMPDSCNICRRLRQFS